MIPQVKIRKSILNKVYPIGSIYMSVNNTNPTTLFGGTWERLKDRFLLGVGDTYTTVNSTGGNSSVQLTIDNMPPHDHNVKASHTHTYYQTNNTTSGHALTINEMPSHSHKMSEIQKASDEAKGHTTSTDGGFSDRVVVTGKVTNWSVSPTGAGQAHSHNILYTSQNTSEAWINATTETVGGSDKVNIMPPYLAVYMWKRTA